MISLKDYVLEKLFINESVFKNVDYDKHNYEYIINILTTIKSIISGEDASLTLFVDSKGLNPSHDKHIVLTKNDFTEINNIDDYINNVNKKLPTINEFDNFFMGVLSDAGKKKIKTINTKSLFTRIYKSQFSGKGANRGQSDCEEDEILVSYLFNKHKKSQRSFNTLTPADAEEYYDNDNNIQKWLEAKNYDKNWLIKNYHLQSAILTVQCLFNEFNKLFGKNLNPADYVAYQCNGKTLTKEEKPSNNINKLFSSRENLEKFILGNNSDSDLFIQKDNWNKGDIFLIDLNKWNEQFNKTKNEQIKLQKINNNVEDIAAIKDINIIELNASLINNVVNEMINQRIIIPISLKKIENGMSPICWKEQDLTYSEEQKSVSFNKENCNGIHIIPPSEKLDDNSLNCSWYLETIQNDTNDKYSIQFRLQADPPQSKMFEHPGNLSIEAKLNKSRMGKGITALQIKFGKNSKELYYNYDESEDNSNLLSSLSKDNNKTLQKILNDCFNISYNKDIDKSIKSPRFKLSNRTATIGLLGIYKHLVGNLKSHNEDDLYQVFNDLWTICAVSTSKYPSQWWIVMGGNK